MWLDNTFTNSANCTVASFIYNNFIVKFNNEYYSVTSSFGSPPSYVGEANDGSEIYMAQGDFYEMSGQPVYDSRYLTNQIGTVQEVIF